MVLRNRKAIMEKVWEGAELIEAGDVWVAGWRIHCIQGAGFTPANPITGECLCKQKRWRNRLWIVQGRTWQWHRSRTHYPYTPRTPTWEHQHFQHLHIICTFNFSIRNTNQTPNPILSLVSQAVGTAECQFITLTPGDRRSHQNKTVKHVPVSTRTNCFCESDYRSLFAPHEQAAQPQNSGCWRCFCTSQNAHHSCSHPTPTSWTHQ